MKNRDTRSFEVLRDWVGRGGHLLSPSSSETLINLINAALDEQDKITRHRCAEIVTTKNTPTITTTEKMIMAWAHNAIMNSGEE